MVPGVNVLIVTTSVAEEPRRAREQLLKALHDAPSSQIDFGDGVHHSNMRRYWKDSIELTSARATLWHVNSTNAIDNAPFDGYEWVQRLSRLTKDGVVKLTQEQAREFQMAYDAGIQQVSEILIMSGLW